MFKGLSYHVAGTGEMAKFFCLKKVGFYGRIGALSDCHDHLARDAVSLRKVLFVTV